MCITIFASTGPAQIHCAAEVVSHSDFIGKYQLNPGRTLSVTEQMLVPKLEDWYIIPKEVVDICIHAKKTTGLPMQMRNFLLRGPAGTGKTMGAKAIAAGSMRDWITVVKVAKYREPQTPPKAVSTANQIKPDTGNNPGGKRTEHHA